MLCRFLVLGIATVAVALLGPARAVAHDLRVVVKLLPDRVQVEAGYDDDTPAEAAKVILTDSQGTVVAEGSTDERGVCHLPKLGPGRYTAKVVSAGHADTVAFEVGSDLEQFSGWRMNRMVGLAVGVGGLVLISIGFWWRQRRKAT
jgi:hypothetical protein